MTTEIALFAAIVALLTLICWAVLKGLHRLLLPGKMMPTICLGLALTVIYLIVTGQVGTFFAGT